MPPGRFKSGGKNMLSISQNSVCLPARAFKTINKIRERTMATVPLLPPSVSFSPPPFFPPILFSLICQYNADIQWFVCTSSPEGTSAQNLFMQADSSGTHTHTHTHTHAHAEAETSTQERKLTQKINICMPGADFLCLSLTRYHTHMHTHTHAHSPSLQPTCSLCAALTERNEPKTNQQRLHKHYTVLEALFLKSLRGPRDVHYSHKWHCAGQLRGCVFLCMNITDNRGCTGLLQACCLRQFISLKLLILVSITAFFLFCFFLPAFFNKIFDNSQHQI